MKKWFEKVKNTNKLGYFCLVFILTVLLVQSGFSLFIETPDGTTIDGIDVVVRTTMSSIFGFIIATSANKSQISSSNTQDKIEIGFDKSNTDMKMTKNNDQVTVKESKSETQQASKPNNIISEPFQIILLTFICLFCLGVIIYVRDFGLNQVKSPSAMSIITQFREFISASIGALIALTRGYSNN